jgi:WD40 repeat protein
VRTGEVAAPGPAAKPEARSALPHGPAPGVEPPAAGTRYYVAIGIDKYQSAPQIPELRNAVDDACAVAHVLEQGYGYRPLVPPLLDQAATHAVLTDLLDRLAQEEHPDGSLLFYFAGHGTAKDDPRDPIGYLVPQDALDEEDPQAARLLPMPDVRARLEQARFRHVLAILDCCHAGAIGIDESTRSALRAEGVQYEEVYEEYLRQPSRQALSSATFSQKASDSTRFGQLGQRGGAEHSPFADALLGVLQGDDEEVWQEGVLTASDLLYHVRRKMRQEEQTQIPGLWTLDGHQVDFLFEPGGRARRLRAEPGNPYRGLLPHEVGDSDLFFGRSDERDELVRRVSERPLTALVGRSGVGKSSLLRAGMVASLLGPARPVDPPAQRPVQQAAYPPGRAYDPGGGPPWGALLLRPQAAPLSALAAAMGALLGREVGAVELGERGTKDGLAALVESFALAHPGCRLLLAVDQLEDLVFESKQPEAAQFLNLLGRALDAHPDVLRVAVALRADSREALKKLAAGTALAGYWEEPAFYPVPEMGADGLREAVTRPLRRCLVRFEAEGPRRLEDTVLDDVSREPGALPLLSFTLSQMYERYAQRRRLDRFADRVVTYGDYEAVGRVAGALSKGAEQVYGTLVQEDAACERTIRNLMLRLVQASGAARSASEEELTYPDPAETERTWKVVDALQPALLVVTGAAPHRRVEVAHSALVQSWPRLLEWKAEAEEALPLQRRLADAAAEWAGPGNRTQSSLLWDRDPRLFQALWEVDGSRRPLNRSTLPEAWKWVASTLSFARGRHGLETGWLSSIEAEFVRASLRRKLVRSLRAWIAVAAVIILTATAALVSNSFRIQANHARATAVYNEGVALEQKGIAERQARIALSRGLAAQAFLWMDREPDLALLLGAEAVHQYDTFDARDSLLRTLQSRPALASTLRGYEYGEVSAAWRQDGKILTSGGGDGMVRLWSADTGQALGAPLRGHEGEVRSLAWRPDGAVLASAGEDGTVRLWDATSLQLLRDPLDAGKGGLWSLAWRPDGKVLASIGCVDEECQTTELRMWDAGTGLVLDAPLHGPERGLFSVAWRPDGAVLATGGVTGTVQLWDMPSGQALGEPLDAGRYLVLSLAWRPDGGALAAIGCVDADCRAAEVRTWDAITAQPLDHLLSSDEGGVWSLAWRTEGLALASAGDDGKLQVRDVATGLLLRGLDTTQGGVDGVTWRPDGMVLASAGGDGTLRLWDVATGQALGEPLLWHTGEVYSAVWRPDGQELATAGYGGTVMLWDAATGQALPEPLVHGDDPVTSLAWRPDGAILASADPWTVRLWNAATGEALDELPVGYDRQWSLAWRPDGQVLASAGEEGTVELWDVATGQVLGQPEYQGQVWVWSLAWRPDGSVLASAAADSTVMLWDGSTGQALDQMLHTDQQGVHGMAWRPDGKVLALGGHDGTVGLWDPAVGQAVPRLPLHHEGEVSSVAWRSDGAVLASAGYDGTVQLWDAVAAKPLGEPLRGYLGQLNNLAWRPDGEVLASAGENGVLLWDADPALWQVQACRAAGRNLSKAEWDYVVGAEVPYQCTCPDLPPGEGVRQATCPDRAQP